MGVFQKFNGWLNDRGGKSAHGADAGKISGNAYYASSEAEQAYGSLRTVSHQYDARCASVLRIENQGGSVLVFFLLVGTAPVGRHGYFGLRIEGQFPSFAGRQPERQ